VVERRLNVRPSEDGVPRATVRVEFRVGLDDLVGAAGYAVEKETCWTAKEMSPRHALERLTRAEILQALRTSYHEYGDTGATVNGANLGETGPMQRYLIEIARSRVTALFPEFATPTQHEETP
jgi:hypothetical protein